MTDIQRPALIESQLGLGALLINAPVGFGKTTLMTQHRRWRADERPELASLWLQENQSLATLTEFVAQLAAATPIDDYPCVYIDNWQAATATWRSKVLTLLGVAPVHVIIASRDAFIEEQLPSGSSALGSVLGSAQLRLNFSDIECLVDNDASAASRIFRETLGWPLAIGLLLQQQAGTVAEVTPASVSESMVTMAQDVRLQSRLWAALSGSLTSHDWQRLLTLTLFSSLYKQWFDAFEQQAIDDLLRRRFSGLHLQLDDQFALLPLLRQALILIGFRHLENQYRLVHLQLAQQRAARGDTESGIALMIGCGERAQAVALLSQHGGLIEWIRFGLGKLDNILALFDQNEADKFDEVAWLSVIVNFKRGRVDLARRMVNRHWQDAASFEWSLADALLRLYEGRLVEQQQLDFLHAKSWDAKAKPFANALVNNILVLVALQQGDMSNAMDFVDRTRRAYKQDVAAEYGETFLDVHQAHVCLVMLDLPASTHLLTRASSQVQAHYRQDLSIRLAWQGIKRELAFFQGELPPINAIGQLIRKLNHSEAVFDLYASVLVLATRSAMHFNKPRELSRWFSMASEASHKRRLAHLNLLINYLARLALYRWPELTREFGQYVGQVADEPLSLPWRLQQLHLEWCDRIGHDCDSLCQQLSDQAATLGNCILHRYCQWLLAVRQDDQARLVELWQELDQQGLVGMAWLVKHKLEPAQWADCLQRHQRSNLLQTPVITKDDNQLSRREMTVMALVRQQHRNKQIAIELGISEQTVKFHLKNIYRKLGVSGRRQAVNALNDKLPNC